MNLAILDKREDKQPYIVPLLLQLVTALPDENNGSFAVSSVPKNVPVSQIKVVGLVTLYPNMSFFLELFYGTTARFYGTPDAKPWRVPKLSLKIKHTNGRCNAI